MKKVLSFLATLSIGIMGHAQGQISRDGKFLVSYEKLENHVSHIYIQDLSGQKHFLTNGESLNYNPQWSKDGENIIFYRKDPDTTLSEVIIYDLEENREHVCLNSGYYDGDPSFSTNGKMVAFTSNRVSKYNIYIQEIGANDAIPLTDNSGNNWGPTWSPDDQRIAFVSDINGNFEVFTVDVLSKETKQLSAMGGENYKPDWSPDGNWISFFHRDSPDQKFDLYLISWDGKQILNITDSPEIDEYTCGWNGQKVYYFSENGIKSYNLSSKTTSWIKFDR